MKFNVGWLKAWVPVAVPTATLCEQLTNAGLEVEAVEAAGPTFTGVVVGQVQDVRPHPNADALSVCQVDAGREAPLAVVCGAPNVRAGGRYPLATVGAKLPDGTKVRRAKLRGSVSEGMLCSAVELGLGDDDGGLLDLPADAPLGADLQAALGLDDEAVTLDLTPNRGDCLSLRGLAREAAALNDLAVSPPPCPAVAATSDAALPVEIEHAAGCPRYLGRVLAGVDMRRQTPFWLRERLRRCGLRPIDPVVDVTNYVMLELGQPMHAFDLGTLRGGIVVRGGRGGETLTLLDGTTVQVDEEAMVIADHERPVALAGVMGGRDTGVTPTTRDVFLESAFFAPVVVAATARRFGLHSDAAHRYERGVDWALPAVAMERATALLLEVVGGSPGPVVAVEHAAHLPKANSVRLRRARLDALVGEAIPTTEVTRIFERLELAPKTAGSGADMTWTVTAPSHRFDLAREEDLAEEVLRIHGYNAVASRAPTARLSLSALPASTVHPERIEDLLADLGYAQAVTYSFIDPALAAVLDPNGTPARVLNPVSSAHAVMRTNILPGLVAAARTNLARQAERVRLFEIGQCFATNADGIEPTNRCGGILIGPREQPSWAQAAADVDFFDVKGDVERLCALSGAEVQFARAAEDPILHPGQAAVVTVGGAPAGRLGRLRPQVAAALDLPRGVFVFDLDVAALSNRRPRRHQALSRQPAVRRDLALVVDEQTPAGRIEAVVRRTLGELLAELRVFDVYAGPGVAAGSKSVAIGLTLQHPTRTLEEPAVRRQVDRAVAALADELGARLRS